MVNSFQLPQQVIISFELCVSVLHRNVLHIVRNRTIAF